MSKNTTPRVETEQHFRTRLKADGLTEDQVNNAVTQANEQAKADGAKVGEYFANADDDSLVFGAALGMFDSAD